MKWLISLLLLFSCAKQKVLVTRDLSEYSASRTPTSESFLESDSPIFALYAGKIKTALEDEITWKAIKLPPEYHMPSSGPLGAYYNTDIIWAYGQDGKIISGFRPINTTTGCNSGCTPVVFHLQFTERGEILDLFQEKDHLLRKVYHQPYSEKDLEKAKILAKTLPEALQLVNQPKQVANELTVFPPQTWVAYKDLLVEQSAYTSFRIFEAANQVKSFLSRSPYQKNKIKQEIQYAQNLLYPKNQNIQQIRQAFSEIKKILDSNDFSSEAKKNILSNPHFLLLNMVRLGDLSDILEINKFLSRRPYQTTHKLMVCDFYQNLLKFTQGQSLLIKIAEGNWPACEDTLDQLLPLFAATAVEKREVVEKLASKINLIAIPPIVLNEPDYLMYYLKMAKILENKDLEIRVLAEVVIRFPKLDLKSTLDGLNEQDKTILASLQKKSERNYREEFHRLMLQEPLFFPMINGFKGERVTVTLPLQTKQVYVFFASWCPHCKATVTSWINEGWGKEFWDKVQLVEIFPKTQDNLAFEEFCKVTGITEKKPEICSEVVRLGQGPKVDQFYEKMALSSVPKITILHKNGRVGIFDYQFPHKKGQDFLRDLNWIIEELTNL